MTVGRSPASETADLELHLLRVLGAPRKKHRFPRHLFRLFSWSSQAEPRNLSRHTYISALLTFAGFGSMYDVPEQCLTRVTVDKCCGVGVHVAENRTGSVPFNK